MSEEWWLDALRMWVFGGFARIGAWMCWKLETRKTTNLYRLSVHFLLWALFQNLPETSRRRAVQRCVCWAPALRSTSWVLWLSRASWTNWNKWSFAQKQWDRAERWFWFSRPLDTSIFISISAKARCEPLKPLLFRSSIYSLQYVMCVVEIYIVPFLHSTFPSKHASFYAQALHSSYCQQSKRALPTLHIIWTLRRWRKRAQ